MDLTLTNTRLAELRKQRQELRERLREVDIRIDEREQDSRSSAWSGDVSLADIRPLLLEARTHGDKILVLVRAYPHRFTSKQIQTILEPLINSKAIIRRKVLSSELSDLRKEGRIQVRNGLFYVPAGPGDEAAPT